MLSLKDRTHEIYAQNLDRLHRQVDRGFVWLLLGQWLFAILIALVLSPLAWEGQRSAIHLHLQVALVFGGILNALPIAWIVLRPGWAGTRFAVACVQMLWSALLIHLTGGRIETHFHVFGSLAFLSIYRDWRVLILATVTVAADHFVRGLLWPESVYGIANPEWWRFLEHAGWVVFEVTILLLTCHAALGIYRMLAEREAKLESANAEIESRVVERTEELRHATLAAQSASLAKSQFLANMSHELRTPMNGVLGFTNLLLDTPLGDEQRDHVQTIRHSGELLLEIINDILDFSACDTGKLALQRIPYDPRRLAEEVIELHFSAATRKGLALELSAAHQLPYQLEGDPARVRQVLSKLVGNGIKFTVRGSVRIELDLLPANHPDGRDQLRFSVIDTGIGIVPEKHASLFEEFVQADTSNTRQYGGTGLGLAISKRLVEAMGGRIGLTSEPGHGSSFWFTLPTT